LTSDGPSAPLDAAVSNGANCPHRHYGRNRRDPAVFAGIAMSLNALVTPLLVPVTLLVK
jgi:hypothetical protein